MQEQLELRGLSMPLSLAHPLALFFASFGSFADNNILRLSNLKHAPRMRDQSSSRAAEYRLSSCASSESVISASMKPRARCSVMNPVTAARSRPAR